jgi:DNA-binding NarL/FixJ family response regulator
MKPTCDTCKKRASCTEICPAIESRLPGIEAGAVHGRRDARSIHRGQLETRTILDFERHYRLTEAQKQAIWLYYREGYDEPQIAEILHTTQQAISERLSRARHNIGVAAKRGD